jgi:hypothetical protein
MRKLDAGSRIEAIRTAEEQGWISDRGGAFPDRYTSADVSS